MKICYIVGAGDFDCGFEPKENDLVIAADGGYDNLKKFDIRCDLLLGDLDSIKEIPTNQKIKKICRKKGRNGYASRIS